MTPVILYRRLDNADENEVNAINANSFKLTESRLDIKYGELVIGRYSVLPYYQEQERDIDKIGAKLINSYKQHLYIANLRNWYEDLKEFTPKTWFSLEGCNYSGPFVLKGHTNSRKFQWDTHVCPKPILWRKLMTKIYYIVDDKEASMKDVFQRLSGYVEYDKFEEASGILDIRDSESVYQVIQVISDDNHDPFIATTVIKRCN